MTQAHSTEPKRPWHEYAIWEKWVDEMLALFVKVHQKMVEVSSATPTYFVTYEELVAEPEHTLGQLFCFLLEVKTIEGTLVELMIKKSVEGGISDARRQAYKLKPSTGRLCGRKDHYTSAQLSKLNTSLRDYMHFWGYANPPSSQESNTVFAHYDN
jgi:hypothetical protein